MGAQKQTTETREDRKTGEQAPSGRSTVDADEVAQFSRLAAQWWDPRGPFKPLHDINPLRIGYIRDHACRAFGRDATSVTPLAGLSLLDIGCGGGLICEPMARLGATVTGIDASQKNIAAARTHAQETGLAVTYRETTAEAQAEAGAAFDLVLALEIIEHVADVPLFMRACGSLVKPDGLLVMSTINRTAKSLLLAKIGAEYVLRLLPRGTHDWRKFVRPSEMAQGMAENGLHVEDICGMVYRPLQRDWALSTDNVAVNYLMAGRRKE